MMTDLSDPWIPEASGFRGEINQAVNYKVADFILQPRGVWDSQKLLSVFPWEVVKQIMMIPLGPQNMQDKWVWHYDPKGKFTIRSCYKMLQGSELRDRNESESSIRKLWRWIWGLKLPPKLKFFFWRLVQNALTTKANLKRRNCANDALCCSCATEEETNEHLFFHCAERRVFWNRNLHDEMPSNQNMSMKQWLCGLMERTGAERMIDVGYGLWNIWKARNFRVFNGTEMPNEENVRIEKVRRSEVQLADRVAKMMRDGVLPMNWLSALEL
ncbi:hypothetical protein LINPERHAP2_LOCUS8335 [Linum perenne]